ncbi:MAG: WVD2 family protein [Candidatus Omnitrophica bacterium]|nr:WVD2 family protein [Candidatus Omnitrophota bacterium]
MPDTEQRPQIIDPRFPYLEHDAAVAVQRTNETVKQGSNVVGQMAQKPKVAIESFVDGFQGKSDANPYERPKPYFYDDYNRDVLGQMGKDLMEPFESSEMAYPKALRSPYLVEGEDVDLTKEAILYKQQLDEVNKLIMAAEEYVNEKDFLNALAKVNQALDLDPASEMARAMHAKIIRAEERARYEQELERKQAAEAEKLEQEQAEIKKQEDMKKARLVEEYIIKIDQSLTYGDYDEAKRLAELMRNVAPDNPRAREISDQVDLALFKRSLDPRILHNDLLMEDLILEHFRRYQEYADTGLDDLADRELKKIAFLESLKSTQ